MFRSFAFSVSLSVLVWAALCPIVECAQAESPTVEHGMTYQEVVQRWGPPGDRVVYETMREELWKYQDAEVRFHGGKVIQVSLLAAQDGLSGDDSGADSYSRGAPADERQVAVEDILTEIMRELPEGEEAKGKGKIDREIRKKK